MFLCYYVAWPFSPWPLTFWPCVCFMYSASHVRPTYQFFIILRLSYTELRVLNIWSHIRYLKQSLRMRRVTWPLTGNKNSPHFCHPWPQFSYTLCHFQGAATKIEPCYLQKIAFFHYEGYKVYSARDLCIGGPPKLHVTIFWPRIAFLLYNFYGATMTIRVVYIGASPC